MKNEIEIYAYITTDRGICVYVSEDIWYGEAEAKWRSHGLRFQSGKGDYLKVRMPIEDYFDYIAKTIPEKNRTERIKKWLETKNTGAKMKMDGEQHD